jgi:hypothetical protein
MDNERLKRCEDYLEWSKANRYTYARSLRTDDLEFLINKVKEGSSARSGFSIATEKVSGDIVETVGEVSGSVGSHRGAHEETEIRGAVQGNADTKVPVRSEQPSPRPNAPIEIPEGSSGIFTWPDKTKLKD